MTESRNPYVTIPNSVPRDQRRSGMARPTYEESPAGPRPRWLKVRLQANKQFFDVRELVHSRKLNTVCESASCPNIGECWAAGTLTFMILGNVCTRSCGFCDVQTGKPGRVDIDEPRRVGESLEGLGLNYAVITSVDRDDLPDGGAFIWAETIRQIKKRSPDLKLEVLTGDFKGDHDCIATVVEAGPDVFAHNIETVDRLHLLVRPQAKYERTLDVLRHARSLGAVTKTGMMAGLGETNEEIVETLQDLADAGVEIVSLGQYMRPSDKHLPVQRWVTPDEFAWLREEGMKMGFAHIESGPLVRSSYHADQQAKAANAARQGKLVAGVATNKA
ncbi:MAG: lipoic acid synthetase [Bradymonadia bacterium]|jgi:lipoic acid synthetase